MGSRHIDIVPYWHVNVPESEREVECPEFLLNLSDKDYTIISTPDADYPVTSWEEVQQIARLNQLDKFQRVPSELRRYRAYTYNLVKFHGSIANYILNDRLKWGNQLKPRGAPFEFEDDYKILLNDWPYGIDPRIVHIVVWTKFEMNDDPVTGDLTKEGWKEIDDFVTRTFRSHIPNDQITWFKNWRGLKSVGAVEHFHVMMFDPDPDFVRNVTKGDIPQCEVFETPIQTSDPVAYHETFVIDEKQSWDMGLVRGSVTQVI